MVSLDRWKRAQEAEQQYDIHSEIIESTDWTERWLENRFSLDLSHLHGKRILEVGCGAGMIHSFDFPGECIGIDPLIATFDVDLTESHASILNGAGEALPFEEEAFDLVICYNVLDHTSNPISVLDEIRRVLQNGGELLFQVNVFQTISILRRLADHVDAPHPHHFTRDDVREILECADFEILQEDWTDETLSTHWSIKRNIATAVFGFSQYHARSRGI